MAEIKFEMVPVGSIFFDPISGDDFIKVDAEHGANALTGYKVGFFGNEFVNLYEDKEH